jgi:thioredoxin-related protein
MKILKMVLLIIFFFLFACSNPKDTTVKEKQTFTINMVSHGQASDPFWSTVKNGAVAVTASII